MYAENQAKSAIGQAQSAAYGCAVPAPKESEIHREFSRLNAALQLLGDVGGNLADRLAPILGPDTPEVGKQPGEPICLSDIGNRLCSATRMVEQYAEGLRRISVRLAL